MSGLFQATDRLERIPMPDADVSYLNDLDLGLPPQLALHRLIADVPWRQESIVVWNKMYPQPRLIASYGDRGADYTYSGLTLSALPWTELLLEMKGRVESVAEASFNNVLLNYYRDHRDSMGFHSDDEPELGPVIASLSLGEERTFLLKHKRSKSAKAVRLKLASGSLLLMKGETQRNWKHGIAKLTRPCGPRVNLTFRQIVPLRGEKP
jgi:alkylated DNA repair dioxygenase AlkB